MTRLTTRFLAMSALALGVAFPSQAAEITGAGASFPAPIYATWAEADKAATGNVVNYQATGSGGGGRQITAKTPDAGAADDPVPGDRLEQAGLVQIPAIIGG